MLVIVRFIRDWGVYAAQDEAAFTEQVAGELVQKGIARLIGPVDGVKVGGAQLELQPMVPDERGGRRK